MPRGPAPPWRVRMQPVTDDYLLASISQSGGKHDLRGAYAELVIRGLADRDEATEYVRSLFRCALWLNRNRKTSISVTAKTEQTAKGWQVRFTVFDKVHARKYMLETHGPDVNRWPYNPRRRGA